MGEPVECRSDGDYAGRPMRIHWHGKSQTVKEVLASWRTPHEKHYRVITLEDEVFECSYSETDDHWSIKEF